jgi:hypothetical protein
MFIKFCISRRTDITNKKGNKRDKYKKGKKRKKKKEKEKEKETTYIKCSNLTLKRITQDKRRIH